MRWICSRLRLLRLSLCCCFFFLLCIRSIRLLYRLLVKPSDAGMRLAKYWSLALSRRIAELCWWWSNTIRIKEKKKEKKNEQTIWRKMQSVCVCVHEAMASAAIHESWITSIHTRFLFIYTLHCNIVNRRARPLHTGRTRNACHRCPGAERQFFHTRALVFAVARPNDQTIYTW